MSNTERRADSAVSGVSAPIDSCPKRLRIRLMASNAPGLRRRSRKATDSGSRNHTRGMNAAVTQPPKMKTSCQVPPANNFCTTVPPITPPIGYPITIRDIATLRQRWLDNSAAAALIEASMPPIPRPVSNRQMSSVGTPPARLAPNIPMVMADRQPRMVGRRPILSATPPSSAEPTPMPTNSIDRTQPSVALSTPQSFAIPGEAKLIDRTSKPSIALSPTVTRTANHWLTLMAL